MFKVLLYLKRETTREENCLSRQIYIYSTKQISLFTLCSSVYNIKRNSRLNNNP